MSHSSKRTSWSWHQGLGGQSERPAWRQVEPWGFQAKGSVRVAWTAAERG